MADRLISLLVPRTVLIVSGKSIGTGCFIAPGYVLTCAHVVREPLLPGESISIQYNTGDPQKKDSLKAVAVKKVILSDYTEGKEYPDVAILEIEEQDHPLLQLSPAAITYKADQEYLAVGFQKKEMETGRNIAQTVSLNYEGEEGAGYMNKLLFENGLVRPGMSGAPLVERQSGQIVGIVHMTRDANTNLGAVVIPVDKIWQVIEEKAPGVYAALASKKVVRQVQNEYSVAYPRFPMIREYGFKLLILPLILFFLLFWVFRNIGEIQQAEYVAALLVVIGFSGKLLSDWMGSDVAIETGNAKSKAGAYLFRWPVIGFLGVITLGLWLCVTSVIIYNHDDSKRVAIKLSRVVGSENYRSQGFGPDGKMQFLVPIIPFQDTVYLEPKENKVLQVVLSSFQRKALHYPDSFILEPVLLLTFDHNLLGNESFGNYEIHIKSDLSRNELITNVAGEPGSLMIGKRQMFFSEELEADLKKDLSGYDNITLEHHLKKWKNASPIRDVDLRLGSHLEITLINKEDTTDITTRSFSIEHDNNHAIFYFISNQ